MKAIKFMISGALLILLGPSLVTIDLSMSPVMVFCWLVGIPLFFIGLFMPTGKTKKHPPYQLEDLPQKQCPACGKYHDFDYPSCPHCAHEYGTAPNGDADHSLDV